MVVGSGNGSCMGWCGILGGGGVSGDSGSRC